MTVEETHKFVGSHHYGFLPIGLPDDGFGNGAWEEGLLGPRPASALEYLYFMFADET